MYRKKFDFLSDIYIGDILFNTMMGAVVAFIIILFAIAIGYLATIGTTINSNKDSLIVLTSQSSKACLDIETQLGTYFDETMYVNVHFEEKYKTDIFGKKQENELYQEIKENYEIEQVPTILWIDDEGKSDGTSNATLKESLYLATVNKNGKTTLNIKELNRLIKDYKKENKDK